MEINNIIDISNNYEVMIYQEYLNNCIDVFTKLDEDKRKKFNSTVKKNPILNYIERQEDINKLFSEINYNNLEKIDKLFISGFLSSLCQKYHNKNDTIKVFGYTMSLTNEQKSILEQLYKEFQNKLKENIKNNEIKSKLFTYYNEKFIHTKKGRLRICSVSINENNIIESETKFYNAVGNSNTESNIAGKKVENETEFYNAVGLTKEEYLEKEYKEKINKLIEEKIIKYNQNNKYNKNGLNFFINPFFENKLLKEYIEFINEPIKKNKYYNYKLINTYLKIFELIKDIYNQESIDKQEIIKSFFKKIFLISNSNKNLNSIIKTIKNNKINYNDNFTKNLKKSNIIDINKFKKSLEYYLKDLKNVNEYKEELKKENVSYEKLLEIYNFLNIDKNLLNEKNLEILQNIRYKLKNKQKNIYSFNEINELKINKLNKLKK